jgi:hypothetical protein
MISHQTCTQYLIQKKNAPVKLRQTVAHLRYEKSLESHKSPTAQALGLIRWTRPKSIANT